MSVIFWCSEHLWVFGVWVFLFVFLYKNPYISWLPHYVLRTVPWSYLIGCLLGLSPQWVHWINHFSTFRLCNFFQLTVSATSEGTQSRLVSSALTPQGSGALVPTMASWAHLPPQRVQMNLGKSLLVLGSPIIGWWSWVLFGGVKLLFGGVGYLWNLVSRRGTWVSSVKDTE